MKCLNDETIIRYFNNLLEEDELKEIRKHLDMCKECAKALEAEMNFDLSLKKALKEDYDLRQFVGLVLAKIGEKTPRKGSLIGRFALAGSLLYGLAVFNSFFLLFLFAKLSRFSLARMIINAGNLFHDASVLASAIHSYFNFVMPTIYLALAVTLFAIFFAKKMLLKTGII